MSARSREEEKAMFANIGKGGSKGISSEQLDNDDPIPPENNGTAPNRMLDDDNGGEEPIGDLNVNQRKAVEKHVGSKIESFFEEGFDSKLYQFENGEEWSIFESFEDAEREAIARVKDDIENEPEIFNEGFLDQHIMITETDKNLIAREDADSQVEDRDLDELKDEANRLGISFDDPEDELDEDDPDFETKLEKANDVLATQLREEVSDKIAEDILPQLDDPIQYFVEDQGIYSKEDLLKASFIQVDEDSAARDAVDTDGVAHFLSSYDGEEVEVDGLFMYRRN